MQRLAPQDLFQTQSHSRLNENVYKDFFFNVKASSSKDVLKSFPGDFNYKVAFVERNEDSMDVDGKKFLPLLYGRFDAQLFYIKFILEHIVSNLFNLFCFVCHWVYLMDKVISYGYPWDIM
jgi:hypothetical protein